MDKKIIRQRQALQIFQDTPEGTLVFVWGKTLLLSDGIRVAQRIECISDILRVGRKFKIPFSLRSPTHVEVKVTRTRTVSAEFKGVQLVNFARLLEKDVSVSLAIPKRSEHDDAEFLRWQKVVVHRCRKKVGTVYDFFGILSFLIRPFWRKKNHHWSFAVFCSELSCKAWKLAGGVWGDAFTGFEPSKTSPEEMYLACLSNKNVVMLDIF